jgi:hypothetical protein
MSKKSEQPALSRRTIFAGASAAGAVATLAAVLPRTPAPVALSEVARAAVDSSGGYQLTPHVLRYYQTAKV